MKFGNESSKNRFIFFFFYKIYIHSFCRMNIVFWFLLFFSLAIRRWLFLFLYWVYWNNMFVSICTQILVWNKEAIWNYTAHSSFVLFILFFNFALDLFLILLPSFWFLARSNWNICSLVCVYVCARASVTLAFVRDSSTEWWMFFSYLLGRWITELIFQTIFQKFLE